MYKRYKGKEDLFCAVVADTVAGLNGVVEEKCAVGVSDLSDDTLREAWDMDEAAMMWGFQFLYARRDDYLLLFKCAEGTKYSDFQHDWAEKMTVKSYEDFCEVRNRGQTQVNISKEEMHSLLSAFRTTIYEPFIHGYSWEKIEACCKLVCGLFNW
ncbi:MAG: TetR/AcrR family transcriptional regulator [Anaerotignum sp.]|nr:TetR/AcrR family transcriptional regulator [Anaerotignum sp.]